jgi:ATP-dependent exoDNAse (exonuclease V) beta subunit
VTVALTPPDEAARERIRTDLGTTLFVEAGAGSGKTTALVSRVLALVTSGQVELAEVAAITFTEKAGAELRDRVRRALEETAADLATPGEVVARCRTALDQLDGAAIGTLHAFAQRILTEHPVEAGLPPRIEVLDEVSSQVAFDRRWARVLDELLSDPTLERTILLLSSANVDPAKLRTLAGAFEDAWDLVEDLVPERAPEPPAVCDLLQPVFDAVDFLEALSGSCVDHTDALFEALVAHQEWGTLLRRLGTDDLDLLEALLGGAPKYRKNCGQAPKWRGAKDDVHAQLLTIADAIASARRDVLDACAHHLGATLRRHTLATAEARRAAGTLEFHDLLVLARKVLRDPVHGATVRRSLHDRYRRLLLDEFQDTDPIQIELAARIAAADPDSATDDRWDAVAVAPGRLFVVGDPKQSIYRFRRADIATFLEARQRFAPEAGGTVELTANFRTVAPVIEWVNATFGGLLAADEASPIPQPGYAPLRAQRGVAPAGPPVAAIGAAAHPPKTSADVLRTVESTDVAGTIARALSERWAVRARQADGSEGWRDCRLGDITILVPARTSLPFLEDALDTANIPYRAESSSLVYATRAVRDLLMVLRAADDPTDHLRIVSALRTPLLGCGDDDLFRHKVEQRRSWSYNTPTPPDAADGIVSAGLAFLLDVHQRRHWQSPAELLDHIARERRALELGFAEGRPRDVWRRLRFVIDQARARSEATGGSLRAYLRWIEHQTAEGSRVAESVLPETDDDAVRIMTIHAAKGLEFPIAIVSGMSARPGGKRSAVDVHFPRDGGPVGYRMGKDVITQEFEAAIPLDEQMGYDERLRLLYVACTRACDHLVVSLHRAERAPPTAPRNHTNAEVLVAGMGERLGDLPDLSGPADPLPTDHVPVPTPPPPFEQWRTERDAALASAARPGAVAATALKDDGEPDAAAEPPPTQRGDSAQLQLDLDADGGEEGFEPGLHKRPRDLDLPPWLKGRYGTAVGSAVHGVLQTIDLATGAGLEAAVAAQAQAEAVPDRVDQIAALVRAALRSPVVQEAASAPHWREVYACTPVGDRLLEGYVDLLFRSPEGLVVVDHKTAGTTDSAELDRRVEGYRLQGAAYALALGQATGEPVVRVTFLFLTPAGAVERDLTDLSASMAEVERLVRAGAEIVAS